MNCPPLRASAFGTEADSIASGGSVSAGPTGVIPVMPCDAGQVDHMGNSTYCLERTTPTA
ncbi:hypothetical protein [Halorussus sp. MSC15.2]|uniref:hypothetical protein n=1 Tax=Halorussus sp. MSC15.2 TaxID=2283638 RepID=UPI0013D26C5E|nr:hypothetical protein [Halorussus sp. MSC15.2]NEU58048.1 hypothetical protein [Halorussus sp. MSC15.2]